MCNDTQSNHQLQQEEQQQQLLTKESFINWLSSNAMRILIDKNKSVQLYDMYLKEHGLPLDSIIEGL
jgi:hypothetical protein